MLVGCVRVLEVLGEEVFLEEMTYQEVLGNTKGFPAALTASGGSFHHREESGLSGRAVAKRQ